MKLRLRGFTGIKAGPRLDWTGLDEVSVDFANARGLTAFEGECGSGKSTVLECMHHYPQLVSRDGALWQHCLLRNSEKEFESEFMGRHYRSLIKIDSQSQKTEGFMWVDGSSVVNGKISAFKAYVNDVFGPPFTYFRSQFCPQKSRKTKEMQIENMTAGTFKELLREFLNLQKYAGWEETAKQAGNILQGKVGVIDIRRAGLENRISDQEALNGRLFDLSADIDNLQDRKKEFQKQIQEAITRIEVLRTILSKNAVAEARKADVQQTIDRLTKDMAREKATSEAELEGVRVKYRELAGELAKVETVLKDREAILGAAEREKELNEKIVDQMGLLERVNGETITHQTMIHGLETAIQGLEQELKDLENDKGLRDIDKQILVLFNKESEFQSKIDNAREKLAALDLKDPACQSSTCSFIVAALDAEKILPGLEEQLLDQRSMMLEATKQRDAREVVVEGEIKRIVGDMSVKQKELSEANTAGLKKSNGLTALRENLEFLRLELGKVTVLAARKAEVEIAEARKADLEVRIDETRTEGTLKREAWEEKEFQHKQTINDERERMRVIEEEIDHDAEANLKQEQKELQELEQTHLPQIEVQIQETREKLAKIQGELDRTREAEVELQTVDLERGRLQTDVSEWLYLKNACGKDGLQALEIDGAAPMIIGFANDLLSTAYGTLYSIRMDTVNDNGKEDLLVKIITENGQEVNLDDISGGQRVWSVQALWLAMALLNKEKSQRQFDYFCADEQDGALDTENARHFAALYQSFMQIGKFRDLFFISHRPEVRAMADHVLCFEVGKEPWWRGI